MKVVLGSALGLVVAGGLALVAMPAAAQSDNAATIIKDGGCFAFVPDENGNPNGFFFDPEAAHAVTNSTDFSKIVCQMRIPEGWEPASATRAEGFGCGTYFGITTNSRIVATPGGTLTLVCKVDKPAS